MKDSQDFKKFAAELVSPSELFESGIRSKATARELIELLGSLEHVTRFNLQPRATVEAQGFPADHPLHYSEPAVRYDTSRDEYRRALEDGKIGQALAKLASHRETSNRSQSVIRGPNIPNNKPHSSSPDNSGSKPCDNSNSFQATAAPSVKNVSIKKTEITSGQRRPLCQPILRET